LSDFSNWAEQDMARMYAETAAAQPSQEEPSSADETAARRKAALRGSSPKSRSAETGKGSRGMSYEDIFNEIAESDG